MTETKVPQLPVSEKEADLLKATFKDNESLLKTLRSLFFGFDTTKAEKKLIKETFSDPELKLAIRKKMYPVLSNDVPIGQVADFWMGVDQQIFGQHKDTIYQAVNTKEEVLTMLKKAMNLLDNPDGEKIDLEYTAKKYQLDDFQINLLARNLYIKTIETGLLFIKMTADQNIETPEQLEKRVKKDSVK